MDDDVPSTPTGLMQCLRMLSEEAASMHMADTFMALQEAIAVCRAEAETMPANLDTGKRHHSLH